MMGFGSGALASFHPIQEEPPILKAAIAAILAVLPMLAGASGAQDYPARLITLIIQATPEYLAGFVRSETEKWARPIREAGLSAD
jgi:hypothetical protein